MINFIINDINLNKVFIFLSNLHLYHALGFAKFINQMLIKH